MYRNYLFLYLLSDHSHPTMLLLDGSNDNPRYIRHKQHPQRRLAKSNSPLSLFFVCISIRILLYLVCAPPHPPHTLLFHITISSLFSAHSFLIPSFISYVENGISTNIHSAVLWFLFCFRHPPSLNTFIRLFYSPQHVLLLFFSLFFSSHLPYFLTPFATARSFFS